MKLLIVRHAEAVSEATAGADHNRWLTAHGRETLRAVADVARAQGLMPTHVYASPRVRAVQTAELLVQGLGFTGVIQIHKALDNAPTAHILAPLARHGDDDIVVFVGHNPAMNTLAGHLTGRRHFPGFPTAAACLIEGDFRAQSSTFRWMIDPRSRQCVDNLRRLLLF